MRRLPKQRIYPSAEFSAESVRSSTSRTVCVGIWLDGSNPTEWPERIPAGDVTTMYQQWLETNTDKKLTATKAGKEIGGVMKELGIEKGTGGTRCFTLPELEGVKTRFANLYKTTVDEMF